MREHQLRQAGPKPAVSHGAPGFVGLSNRAMVALVGTARAVQREPAVVGATSEAAGQVDTTKAGPITVKGLLAAYDGVRSDFAALVQAAKGEPYAAPVIARYAIIHRWVNHLNEAFTLMKMDTIDAQATFLAHAYVESDQFRKMVETTGAADRYSEDPTTARLDRKYLNEEYPVGSAKRKEIDPTGQGTFEYLGRGPLQVTNKTEYDKTLDFLSEQATAREAAGDADGAATIRQAVAAIRADPRQAANPQYAFLFSAATMKRAGGDVKAGTVAAKDKTFGGHGQESTWETGSHDDPQAAKKVKGYGQALAMLQAGQAAGDDLPPDVLKVVTTLSAGVPAPEDTPSPALE